jgi:hypothetical protein
MPLAAVTKSGIKIKEWVSRYATIREAKGHLRGPLFGNRLGHMLSAKEVERALMERLQNVKDTQPGRIPRDVGIFEDFGISRSFR